MMNMFKGFNWRMKAYMMNMLKGFKRNESLHDEHV